jgi:hypothetical protein
VPGCVNVEFPRLKFSMGTVPKPLASRHRALGAILGNFYGEQSVPWVPLIFSPLILIPPLSDTHPSSPPDVWESPYQAAHYHMLDL